MINKFWEELFILRDNLKDSHQFTAWNAVGKVEKTLQNVYDDGLKFASVIADKKPDSKVEELVLSIPDIKVYLDNTDHTYFYELDRRHFDYPEEVIEWLITFRTKVETDVMTACKMDMLNAIKTLIENVSQTDVMKRRTVKHVIREENSK